MSVHTPGPWHVDANYFSDVLDSKGADVVTAFTPEGTGERPLDECEANAKLIACAPELLDMLKAANHAFYGDGGTRALEKALLRSKHLIRKAEGKP